MSAKSIRKHKRTDRIESQIGAITQICALLDKRLTILEDRLIGASRPEEASK